MKTEEKFKKCPDFETLSAFSDLEIDRESPEYRHIQTCPICQKRLDGLKKLNSAINSTLLNVIQNEGIEEKVIRTLNYEKKRESLYIKTYPQLFFRVAAVFAIFASLFFYIAQLLIVKKEKDLYSATSKIEDRNLLKKDHPETEVAPLQDSSKIIADTPTPSLLNGFNINEIKSTGTGAETDLAHKILFEENKTGAAFIKPVIKHNWIWSEENKQMPVLRQVIEKYGEIQDISENSFSIKITKANLVKLVREIKNYGFKLLSDEEPLPETTIFAGAPNEIVQYRTTFIYKK